MWLQLISAIEPTHQPASLERRTIASGHDAASSRPTTLPWSLSPQAEMLLFASAGEPKTNPATVVAMTDAHLIRLDLAQWRALCKVRATASVRCCRAREVTAVVMRE
jgi:isocitrate/isopropylmalate dehydrogenase